MRRSRASPREAIISELHFAAPRCFLFFPGSRPDLLGKALVTRADFACLDLEDAVVADAKDEARAQAVAILGGGLPPGPAGGSLDLARLLIRINHPSTADGGRDVDALAGAAAEHGCPLHLVVPKAGAAAELDALRHRFADADGPVRFIAMIETVRGLAHVEEIAAAQSVTALLFGGLDLSIELGSALEWEPLLYARSRVVHAARLAGVGALDMPFLDVADGDGLRAEAQRSRKLGFDGKAAIHPSQVDAILDAFRPTLADVTHARRITEAYEREARGAFLLDGALVDRPVVEAARRVLAAAEGEGT